jgi:hypothetical protein
MPEPRGSGKRLMAAATKMLGHRRGRGRPRRLCMERPVRVRLVTRMVNRHRGRWLMQLLPQLRRLRVGGIYDLVVGSLHRSRSVGSTPLGMGSIGKAEAARRNCDQKHVLHKRDSFAADYRRSLSDALSATAKMMISPLVKSLKKGSTCRMLNPLFISASRKTPAHERQTDPAPP